MVFLQKFFRWLCEKYFFPDAIYQSIYDVDVDALYEKGVRGLILDIDNTLKPPGDSPPDERAAEWINRLRDIGFDVCLLSNSLRGRVTKFSSGLGIYAVSYAKKPAGAGFKKAMRLLGCDAAGVCVIGDQIFTDIFGAKRLGLSAIYTRPITKKEEPTIIVKRLLERIVLNQYR